MTLTMQDQMDARNTIQLNIRKYTLMLCDALEQNFKDRNHGTIGGKYEAPVSVSYTHLTLPTNREV